MERILKTKCRPEKGGILSASATLYPDRIELRGWSLAGRYKEKVLLRNVERVEWWTSFPKTPNTRLTFSDGSSRVFWFEQGGVWRFELGKLIDDGVETGELPGTRRSVANAA